MSYFPEGLNRTFESEINPKIINKQKTKAMKTHHYLFTIALAVFISSCGGGDKSSTEASGNEAPKSMVADPETYDPKRGEGKWTADNLGLGAGLDAAKATEGESISGVKCTSCHKMTDEKLVGPGWAGVTQRRTAEWIMNFITNP